MSPEQTPPPPPAISYGSPGSAIRAGRKRVGMSIEELASRTRLAKATLEAMEADAFDQLLEPVYVRGYYRKCARILDLAEDPLIEAYESMYTPPPKPAPPARLRLASGGDLGTSTRLPRRLVVLAPLAAIVISIVVWVLRDTAPTSSVPGESTVTLIDPLSGEAVLSDTMPPIDAPLEAEAGVPVTGTPIDPAVPAPTGAAPDGATTAVAPQASVPQSAESTTAGSSAAAPAETATAATATPVGTKLVLVFEAISWARVEDASGRSMISGVIAAGERRELDGQPPYSVFLGNAPGVKVEFGGQPVDSSPYVKSNSTARFSVPAAGAN